MNLTRIRANQFFNDVNGLAAEASQLKMELFRSINHARRVDSTKVHKYLGFVNGVLSRYSGIFEDTVDGMKNATPEEGNDTVPYADVKPYLYSNFDYASILKYTDGLYKGLDDGKIKTAYDMDEFFIHTTRLAFKDIPDITPDLLDELVEMDHTKKASSTDTAKFKAVKEQRIFNKSDRTELYKAIEKTIDFLCNEINSKGSIDIATDDITLKIAFIVSVLDYATYSVAAYIGRVYAINMYAYGFIKNEDNVNPVAVTEAAEVKDKVSQEAYKVMIPADDANYRDPKNFVSLIKLLQEFASVLGRSIVDDTKKLNLDDNWFQYKIDEQSDVSNIFKDALIGNPLYEFITNRMSYWRWDDSWKQRQDFADELYSYIYNGHQGLSTSLTAKQEMLPILRDTWADKTQIEDYGTIAANLGEWALEVLSILRRYFNDGIQWRSNEANNPEKNNSVLNSSAEIIKATKDLYNDIVEVVLSRLRDIELKINKDKEDEIQKVFTDVSINVPGGLKSDISTKNDMMDSSPDTSRLPVDLYALPTYESLRMYSEYVETQLGADGYYSEAVDFSKVMDTLQAFVAGLFKKAIQFFDNPKLKAAADWVSKNSEKLYNVTYNGPMEVQPYKADIKYPSIENFANWIQSEFSEKVVSSDDELKNFLFKLYSTNDQTLRKIWQSGDKNTETQVENYILFGVQPNGSVNTKTLNNDAEIKAEMKNWISTVTAAPVLRSTIINDEQKATAAMKTVKSKLISLKQGTPATNQPQSKEGAPEINSTDTNQTTAQQNAQQNTNQNGNNDHRIQEALNGIQTAFQKVVFPAYMIFRRAITDQYNYIKNAYSNSNK